MPLVRGRIVPEVELAGRTKWFLDILVWIEQVEEAEAVSLDELDGLRIYLRSLKPFVCDMIGLVVTLVSAGILLKKARVPEK
jgi:hypothetical protein